MARGFGLLTLGVSVLALAGGGLALGTMPAHRVDILLLFMPLVGICMAGMVVIWLGVAGVELLRGLTHRDD